MIARNLNIPEIKFIPFKGKNSQPQQAAKKTLPRQISDALPLRNAAIDWLYRAQGTLHFSRSTLFLGIALLDKLLTQGMPLTEQNSELVAGTILLIATKFNEVYPVTVRKLNSLSVDVYVTERYVETEGSMLQMVGFDLSPSDPIYEELAELEHRLGPKSQETVKLAVQNPTTAFKLGSSALLVAIESMSTGGLM
jgi:hypothetical protein